MRPLDAGGGGRHPQLVHQRGVTQAEQALKLWEPVLLASEKYRALG